MTASMAIHPTAAQNLLDASHHAAAIGRPLTHLLTIHWAKAHGDDDVAERFERARVCMRHWLQRNGVPLVCIWVMERSMAAAGQHSHMLVHVPGYLLADFTRMLPVWVGGNPADGVIDIRPVYNLGGVRKYILKGVAADHAQRFGIRPVPQGKIHGKRVGVSQSISQTARARWASRMAEQTAEQTEQAA